MRFDFDVAVAGAGPAGSRTARDLAQAGLRVALLEEHRQPGIPSHCSGLISPRTLEEAGIGPEAAIHRISGAFLHAPDGTLAELGGGQVRAVAIDRVRWDQTLCQQAQAAGAELLRGRVTGVARQDGGVLLTVHTDGRIRHLTARLIVGADGAHSRVARCLGLPGPREKAYCLGIEGRLRTPRQDFVHVFVSNDVAPGWFGWIIPVGDGTVRAGIGSTNGAKPIVCYRRMAAAFPQLFAALEPKRMYGGTIPLSFAPRSYADNALLVGDAAGQVKPLSGGGIYTGLVAARHAAEAALEAFRANDLSARRLSSYERRWKAEIGRELARSRRLRNAGLALGDQGINRVVRVLRHDSLVALAARHGDIDYPSRALLRLARSAPAVTTLLPILARRPAAVWQVLRAHLPFAV